MGEIQKAADQFAAKKQELELEKDKHERKQRKLLEAHYADAIPLNLFKEEQTAIADAIAAIDRQLSLHDARFGEVKEKLSKALEIMEDCGAAYRAAPGHIKRAYNQALFEKIFVCPNDEGSCEVRPRFTAPYALIFGQEAPSGAEAAEAGNETETGLETENPASLRGISGLSRQFDEWRNRHPIFLGGGFSNKLLVDVNGLEPLTLRTSSGVNNRDYA